MVRPRAEISLALSASDFLSPAVGHGFQKRDECRRRGEDDSVIHAALDQAGIGMEGGGEEGFAGQEKDGELRGVLELVGVFLGRKLLDVGADLLGVLGEETLALHILDRFEGVEVGIHWRLGIDDDGFPTGKFHDKIGAEALALIGSGTCLERKIAMLLHSGELDNPAELHLAPLAASSRLAEGFHERGGLALESELAFTEGADLLFQFRVCPFPEFSRSHRCGARISRGNLRQVSPVSRWRSYASRSRPSLPPSVRRGWISRGGEIARRLLSRHRRTVL